MASINRILCPVDFSEFSLDALRHGLVLSNWYRAELRIFHVAEPPPTLLPVKGLPGNVPLTQPQQSRLDRGRESDAPSARDCDPTAPTRL